MLCIAIGPSNETVYIDHLKPHVISSNLRMTTSQPKMDIINTEAIKCIACYSGSCHTSVD
jgi:hypothetical protein